MKSCQHSKPNQRRDTSPENSTPIRNTHSTICDSVTTKRACIAHKRHQHGATRSTCSTMLTVFPGMAEQDRRGAPVLLLTVYSLSGVADQPIMPASETLPSLPPSTKTRHRAPLSHFAKRALLSLSNGPLFASPAAIGCPPSVTWTHDRK